MQRMNQRLSRLERSCRGPTPVTVIHTLPGEATEHAIERYRQQGAVISRCIAVMPLPYSTTAEWLATCGAATVA